MMPAPHRCSVRRDAGRTKADDRFGQVRFVCLPCCRGGEAGAIFQFHVLPPASSSLPDSHLHFHPPYPTPLILPPLHHSVLCMHRMATAACSSHEAAAQMGRTARSCIASRVRTTSLVSLATRTIIGSGWDWTPIRTECYQNSLLIRYPTRWHIGSTHNWSTK